MVATPRSPRLTRSTPPIAGGIGAGIAAALAIVLIPTDLLERLVWTSGVAAFVPAAQPPLGMTARACLAGGAGVVAGAVTWAALYLLFGPGGFLARAPRDDARPSVRRADAHPDAPPRRPMTAADLGTPLMEAPPRSPMVRPLPADLDQPLAAFDPRAIPAMPREPVRPVMPLAPGERLDTVPVAPPPPGVAPTRREPAATPSVDSLLRRLEARTARRTSAA